MHAISHHSLYQLTPSTVALVLQDPQSKASPANEKKKVKKTMAGTKDDIFGQRAGKKRR